MILNSILSRSDSSEAVGIPANGSDDEGDAMLKLPKAPFGMDLDVHSNRSSNISQVFIIINIQNHL